MKRYKRPDYKSLYPEASDEIIEFLVKSDRKMEYQQYDLKRERRIINKESKSGVYIPSREDSLERLIESNTQFIDEGKNIGENEKNDGNAMLKRLS